MIEIGRLCVKLAGRDAGNKCVIVEVLDKNFVMIDGNVRRRKCNTIHLLPLKDKIEIKDKATHEDVAATFKKLKLEVWETKAKESKERPRKLRKGKTPEEKEAQKKSKKQKTAKPEIKKEVEKVVEKAAVQEEKLEDAIEKELPKEKVEIKEEKTTVKKKATKKKAVKKD